MNKEKGVIFEAFRFLKPLLVGLLYWAISGSNYKLINVKKDGMVLKIKQILSNGVLDLL